MGTDAVAVVAASAKPKSKSLPMISRTLVDAKGNTLQFNANQRKDGSATSYVNHITRDKEGKLVKSSRGGTNSHASLDAARAAFEGPIKDAVASGWQERKGGGGGGFKARPDSFDLNSLPKPVK